MYWPLCTVSLAILGHPSLWKSEVEVGNGSRKWMTLPSHRTLVYRARPSLPRVILLSHALNYKRVWRGGREKSFVCFHNTHLTTTTRCAQVRAVTQFLHSDLIGQRLMNTNDFCLSRRATRAYWRAGASQPSRTAGSDFSIYIYMYIYIYIGIYIYIYIGIYTRRMHGIVGERERSNCTVDMRCI